jgi:hypothetical protein
LSGSRNRSRSIALIATSGELKLDWRTLGDKGGVIRADARMRILETEFRSVGRGKRVEEHYRAVPCFEVQVSNWVTVAECIFRRIAVRNGDEACTSVQSRNEIDIGTRWHLPIRISAWVIAVDSCL